MMGDRHASSLLDSFTAPPTTLPVCIAKFEASCDMAFSSRRSPFLPRALDLPKVSPTPSLRSEYSTQSSLPPLTPSGDSSASSSSSDDEAVEILGNWNQRSSRRGRRSPARSLAINIPARSTSIVNDDSSPSIDECVVVVDDIFGISLPAAYVEEAKLQSPVVDLEIEAPDLFHDASEFTDSRCTSPAPIPVRSSSAIRRKPVPVYDPAEFADAALAGASRPSPRRQMLLVDLPPLAAVPAPAAMVIRDKASRSPLAAERAQSFARKLNGLASSRSQALGWWAGRA